MEIKIQPCTAGTLPPIPVPLSQNHSASPVPLSISVSSFQKPPPNLCYQRNELNSLRIIEHGPGLDALQGDCFFARWGFAKLSPKPLNFYGSVLREARLDHLLFILWIFCLFAIALTTL